MNLIKIVFVFFIHCLCAESLIVGMQLQYPPFETVDPDGNPRGISVEFAKALAAYLRRELVIENYPFIGLIPALQSKKIDCIISSMTATSQRLKVIDFSNPYIWTGLCLLISNKSDMQGIADADEEGCRIAVKQGTTGETYALSHFKQAKIISLGEEAACVLEVIQGKVDAFIYDQFSVYMYWRRNLATTRAALKPFKEEAWAVGCRKEESLKVQINQFLEGFLKKGEMDKLIHQHYNISNEKSL